MPQVGGGTVTVIGQAIDNDGNTAGAVAFIYEGFIIAVVLCAGGLFDGALDVIVGHVGGLRLCDGIGKAGVCGGVGAALFNDHNDLSCHFGKDLGTLGIGLALFVLNIMPFGMSGHGFFAPFKKLSFFVTI